MLLLIACASLASSSLWVWANRTGMQRNNFTEDLPEALFVRVCGMIAIGLAYPLLFWFFFFAIVMVSLQKITLVE